MHNKIKATQAELGLSLSKLSQLIGHHSNYLSRALRDGVSTAKQAEIIKKLDELTSNVNADKEQYVSIRYHDQEITKLKNINTELFNDNSIKDFQINQFTKENLELKEIRDILVNERNELQQGLNRACEQLHKESQKMRDAERRADHFYNASNKYRSEKAEMYKLLSVWRFVSCFCLVVIVALVFVGVIE